jgi:hypothetical protein
MARPKRSHPKLSVAQQRVYDAVVQKTLKSGDSGYWAIESKPTSKGPTKYRRSGEDHRTLQKLIQYGLITVIAEEKWKTNGYDFYRRVRIRTADRNVIMEGKVALMREQLKGAALAPYAAKVHRSVHRAYVTWSQLNRAFTDVVQSFRNSCVVSEDKSIRDWRPDPSAIMVKALPPKIAELNVPAAEALKRLGGQYARMLWIAGQRERRLGAATANYVEPPEDEVRAQVIADTILNKEEANE